MTDTDTAADKIAVVRNLYAAAGEGDWDAAEAMLTDDFFVTEAQSLPFAGMYRGKQALRELLTLVMQMVDVETIDIKDITAGGDYAVAILEFVFRKPEGLRAPLAEMFRFRGHQVCEIRPYYFDPADMIAAVEAKRAGGR